MRYLLIGYNPEDSSTFSRITRNILDYLNTQEDNEVYLLAPDTYAINSSISPLIDLPQQFEEAIRSFQPDIVITIGDLSSIETIFHYRNIMSYSWKWISILEIESIPFPTDNFKLLTSVDYIITYSRETYDIVSTFHSNVKYARLGIGSNKFFPLLNKEEIESSLKDFFVIVSPGNNTENNYKIALLEAFSIFAIDKEDVLLYFCDRDNIKHYDLNSLLWRIQTAKHRILFNNSFQPDSFVRDHDINSIYNVAHICVNTNITGKFQLSILESIKCGCNVIMPDHPYIFEDYKGFEGLIHPVSAHKTINSSGGYSNFIDVEGLAAKLEELYIGHKCGKLNSGNFDDFRTFAWQDFNGELEYILSNIKNIEDKEIVSLII